MSLEATTDPWIRPQIGRQSNPAQRAVEPSERAPPAAAPFSGQGHRGANRVFDLGPGADHPTATATLGLDELIDVLNPLQHLPVISNLYRHITGDEIGTPARVMGGTLYGGPLGFVTSLAQALVTEVGGTDPGGAVLAQLLGPAESEPEDLAARPQSPPDVVGRGAQAPLRGEAALEALALDLASPFQNVEQLAAAPTPAPAAAGPEASPQDFFTARMLSGLDKYQTMARARTGAAPPGGRLDQRM